PSSSASVEGRQANVTVADERDLNVNAGPVALNAAGGVASGCASAARAPVAERRPFASTLPRNAGTFVFAPTMIARRTCAAVADGSAENRSAATPDVAAAAADEPPR